MRLGADPEVFLLDPNGKHISAIGLIGADKWNPLQMEELPQGFTLQEDNVALEYGIPPAATEDDFVHHIQTVMKESLKYVYTGVSFSKLSCTIFPQEEMVHPLAFVFGCEPDFNAWTKKENKRPKPPHEHMRSAGGHIHVETDQDPVEVVRKMDIFLGIPSVLMDNGIERKQIYGKAGAHRVKSYGVEYRTPSNFWIFDEKLIRWVWRNTQRALDWNIDDVKKYEELVPHAINNNDKAVAESLIQELNLEVV
jgi:hypothetical protein